MALMSLLFCAFVSVASAQDVQVKTSIDQTQVTIGDPVQMEVRVSRPEGVEILSGRPVEKLETFEILSSELGQVRREGDRLVTVDRYRIAVYDTGVQEIPEVTIGYRTGDGREGEAKSGGHSVEVVSVIDNPEQAQDVRGLKPPLVLGQESWKRLLPWVAGVVLVAALLWWLKRYLKRKPKPVAVEPEVKLPPHEIAFQQLAELKEDREGLIAGRDFEAFSLRVSGVLRGYLQARFGFNAVDQTSGETLEELQRLNLPRDTIAGFREFFDDCDLVKFALHSLEREDMIYLIDLAWRLVDQTREPAGVETQAQAVQNPVEENSEERSREETQNNG
jgi:hypothetical protein